MQISAFWTTPAATRPASSSQTQTVPERLKADADPLLLRQQQAEDALAAAKSIATSSPADQKAAAAKRLADAKAELQALMMWVSDPEVLARLAQQLAAKVGSAAGQFAAGMAAEANAAASGAVATANSAASVAASAATEAGDTEQATDEIAQPATFAQRAYQEMSGNTPDDRSDDQKTMSEFKTIARQIKALLEKARREMAEQQSSGEAGKIDTSIATLDASIDALSSSASSSALMTGTASPAVIPLSITI